MKKIFYSYSSNIKGLPKGVLFLIILFLLILIPIILSIVLIGGVIKLTTTIIGNLLPFKRNYIKNNPQQDPITIDITPIEELHK